MSLYALKHTIETLTQVKEGDEVTINEKDVTTKISGPQELQKDATLVITFKATEASHRASKMKISFNKKTSDGAKQEKVGCHGNLL